jgi:hypothetical protein
MPDKGANFIEEDKVAATLFRSLIHCAANTHTASGVHTSVAEPFKADCARAPAVR